MRQCCSHKTRCRFSARPVEQQQKAIKEDDSEDDNNDVMDVIRTKTGPFMARFSSLITRV